jgi:hypothetical protein
MISLPKGNKMFDFWNKQYSFSAKHENLWQICNSKLGVASSVCGVNTHIARVAGAGAKANFFNSKPRAAVFNIHGAGGFAATLNVWAGNACGLPVRHYICL